MTNSQRARIRNLLEEIETLAIVEGTHAIARAASLALEELEQSKPNAKGVR